LPIFLAFLIIPIVEIALFIQLGSLLGLWSTLAIVVLTALIGAHLVKTQGVAAINDLRNRVEKFEDPTQPLLHGVMILFSGALLLTPGFFTDTIGFLLLFPAVRNYLSKVISQKVKHHNNHQTHHHSDSTIIDADYIDISSSDKSDKPRSGWTKH